MLLFCPSCILPSVKLLPVVLWICGLCSWPVCELHGCSHSERAEMFWHLISSASLVVVGSSWRSTDIRHSSSHCLLTLLGWLDGTCLAVHRRGCLDICFLLLGWLGEILDYTPQSVLTLILFVCSGAQPGALWVGTCLWKHTATYQCIKELCNWICNLATSPPPHIQYTAGLDCRHGREENLLILLQNTWNLKDTLQLRSYAIFVTGKFEGTFAAQIKCEKELLINCNSFTLLPVSAGSSLSATTDLDEGAPLFLSLYLASKLISVDGSLTHTADSHVLSSHLSSKAVKN